jgi:hypothetical protein
MDGEKPLKLFFQSFRFPSKKSSASLSELSRYFKGLPFKKIITDLIPI